MKMIKFPSIEQFNTTIKNLKHYYQYNGKDEEGKQYTTIPKCFQ